MGFAPAMALPPLDDFEIEIRGEAQGWLNSTCTYYDIGWLSEEQASKALLRLMALFKGDYLGEDLARQAKKIALERSPGCRAVGLRSQSDWCFGQVDSPEPCQKQFRPQTPATRQGENES